MRCLKFTVAGLLAHFKTAYTNSSKLTYESPTFTAIEGMLGAIVGFDKHDYHIRIKREAMKLGIRIDNPIKRIMINLNQIDLISPFQLGENYGLIKERTQIPSEHLFYPQYTIYITHADPKLYDLFKNRILRKRSVYPLYLGSAYCMAEILDPDEIKEIEPLHVEKQYISTVVPVEYVSIDLEKGGKLAKDTIPFRRDIDFTMREYRKVVYNPDGGGVCCTGQCYRTGSELIYLFE